MLQCEECRCVSAQAPGWIAKVIADDDEEPDLGPALVFYCPPCAEREFEVVRKRPYD